MTRPAIDHVARAHEALRRLRDLVRVADACGLNVGEYILECARVDAAVRADAMQATERKQREGRRDDPEVTRNRAARARRERGER
jgi:hypothetical protein